MHQSCLCDILGSLADQLMWERFFERLNWEAEHINKPKEANDSLLGHNKQKKEEAKRKYMCRVS